MKKETKNYLKEMTQFLTADAWSEERILELLTNIYIMGVDDGHDTTIKDINKENYCKCH